MKIEIPLWLLTAIMLCLAFTCGSNALTTWYLRTQLENIAGFCEHGEYN